MATLQCHIAGRGHCLDYIATPITTGVIYRGTLYLENILDFCFEVPDAREDILFTPADTPTDIRKAILKTILGKENG